MGVPAAAQGREAKQTQVLVVSVTHCQLRVIYCLVFSYPLFAYSLQNQTSLVALDTWMKPFTLHLPQQPTCSPTSRKSKASKVQTPPGFPLPKTTLTWLPLCHYSALSLTQHTCSIWHTSAPRLLKCSPVLPATGVVAAVPKH